MVFLSNQLQALDHLIYMTFYNRDIQLSYPFDRNQQHGQLNIHNGIYDHNSLIEMEDYPLYIFLNI